MSGVLFVPVEHEGNAQCCDEEVETGSISPPYMANESYPSCVGSGGR
jgi:hypothetical protein